MIDVPQLCVHLVERWVAFEGTQCVELNLLVVLDFIPEYLPGLDVDGARFEWLVACAKRLACLFVTDDLEDVELDTHPRVVPVTVVRWRPVIEVAPHLLGVDEAFLVGCACVSQLDVEVLEFEAVLFIYASDEGIG